MTGKVLIIERDGYTVGYSPRLRQCVWVAYRMIPEDLLNHQKRSNAFFQDPLCPHALRPSDYTGSGYDRGHMAPAADMGFSMKSMRESFLMGNIVPQSPKLNRGPWKRLETMTRKSLISESNNLHSRYVYIISGPIFSSKDIKAWETKCQHLPPGAKVPLLKPRAFFKLVKKNLTIKSTIIDHTTLCEKKSSLKELKRLTGLDLLPSLPRFINIPSFQNSPSNNTQDNEK